MNKISISTAISSNNRSPYNDKHRNSITYINMHKNNIHTNNNNNKNNKSYN